MKLLKLLENMVHEQYTGVDVKMFALFSDVFSELIKGLELGMMDEVYEDLRIKYKDTKKLIPLNYFYEFLIKNGDYFLRDSEQLSENDQTKSTLFKYWDDKGIEAKPIYHYLNLDDSNKDDRKKILSYKIEYFGGIGKLFDLIKQKLNIGKPVIITSGGYEMEVFLNEVNMDIYTGNTNHPLFDNDTSYLAYYDVEFIINEDNSQVTLMTDGETYDFNELGKNPELADSVVDEIGYEIGDVLRNYVDEITHPYGLDSDSVDFKGVSEEDFNRLKK